MSYRWYVCRRRSDQRRRKRAFDGFSDGASSKVSRLEFDSMNSIHTDTTVQAMHSSSLSARMPLLQNIRGGGQGAKRLSQLCQFLRGKAVQKKCVSGMRFI
ncbi:hypothetical protein SAY87_013520 [Trapa incisa]|uniref:Uncharacterized protein n=1 Tax=Trapa incisa TaxID=236973 RepID=A0AAN7KDI9_9MYRT|nr:hypothetical protein SAY87_013520 [Trapa incisa]